MSASAGHTPRSVVWARVAIVSCVLMVAVTLGVSGYRDQSYRSSISKLSGSVDRLSRTVDHLSDVVNRRSVTIEALNQFADRLDCQQAQQQVFSEAIAAVLQTAVDDRATTDEGRALVARLFSAYDDDPRKPGVQACPLVNITP